MTTVKDILEKLIELSIKEDEKYKREIERGGASMLSQLYLGALNAYCDAIEAIKEIDLGEEKNE